MGPQEVRTRFPLLQGLQQRTRFDPQIRVEHVPPMLPSVRQGHRLQEDGLNDRATRTRSRGAPQTRSRGATFARVYGAAVPCGRRRNLSTDGLFIMLLRIYNILKKIL